MDCLWKSPGIVDELLLQRKEEKTGQFLFSYEQNASNRFENHPRGMDCAI